MKIIISHDVDHLYRTDHLKDLIYPKLWVRETMNVFKGRITFRNWYLRMISPFNKIRHHINEVMEFDRKNGVPSTFYFGMSKGLGMSYGYQKAVPVIENVIQQGFEIGVHGIDYLTQEGINKEHERFREIIKNDDFGIRMHYVQYNKDTFRKLNKVKYLYDTSEFEKSKGNCIKSPYKVDKMWEFPLCIMDTYLPYDLDQAKELTIKLIQKAENKNLSYFSILFHDYQYCDAYSVYRDWYQWIIGWLKEQNYEFISYKNAVKELELQG